MKEFFANTFYPFSDIPSDAWNYWQDAVQRSVLFADIIRERGNVYLEHCDAGRPPVLAFDYEIIMDGKNLKAPCNYKLARIIPPEKTELDPQKRPIIIIDPRAGHGPGIGGSKRNSEIGIALKGGHPVYFILFDSYPIPQQTIADVERTEIEFIEEVGRRHPKSPKPTVIGNCQAGWALMMLNADRPGTTGPLVLNGSPLSYWAGVEGKDTMRYLGGLLGGTWVSAFLSDLGDGLFDGANLVMNFELMNWGNTFWKKQYHVYANADTEKERYLQFERWWNGFFHITKAEILFIADNLFIGNKLEKGVLQLNNDKFLDLKEIKDPIVVFCSGGDNITPPQQALNWIFRVWESTGEIKRRQQVIVYVLHKNIGHLGIFVSGKVAQKEHKEIMESYDMIEYLPPGIYEMVIEEKPADANSSAEYLVRFEERRIEDILMMNEGMEFLLEEESFPLAKAVSDQNRRFYESYISPFVKMTATPSAAYFLRQLHPLRVTRYAFSDLNPFMLPVKIFTHVVQAGRKPVSPDNLFLGFEKALSDHTANMLDVFNRFYARTGEVLFKTLYDRFSPLNYFFAEVRKEARLSVREIIEKRRARRQFKKADRQKWMTAMTEGSFAEGLVRIILAIGTAEGMLNREEFQRFEEIARGHQHLKSIRASDFRKIARTQAGILQTDKYWAIKTLSHLLPTPQERDEVIGICNTVFEKDMLSAKQAGEIISMLSASPEASDIRMAG